MLTAIFEAGDMIKHDDEALRRATALSALVYKEKDAAYWYKYFHVVTQNDTQGLSVELGGSPSTTWPTTCSCSAWRPDRRTSSPRRTRCSATS